MKWLDIRDIANALADQHPDVDPLTISFPDMMKWVLALEAFDDDPEHCGERILEAIQITWIEEAD